MVVVVAVAVAVVVLGNIVSIAAAVALKRFGNDLVTGDQRGLIQYCDETFKYILIIENAHSSAGTNINLTWHLQLKSIGPIILVVSMYVVRGLDFSPLDSKLVSCRYIRPLLSTHSAALNLH